MTGSTKFSKDRNSKKEAAGIDLLESNIPSPKTSLITLYQGVQRATDQMANILIHGTAKYNRKRRNKKKKKEEKKEKKNKNKEEEEGNSSQVKKKKWKPAIFQASKKIPLIVFGAGMFGKDLVKLKGLLSLTSFQCLKQFTNNTAPGKLIDEFKTSKTCSLCFSDDLSIIKADNFKGVGVICCKETSMPLTI
ncbi:hypothetical protein [Parasitella parasitica]|uniref:Uncharacterized protein n=1 Tax=Parasitella parasitica TaxID=35722 RepID=A0A0B7MW08_9FUNG|nr:hypothetical protein [Parasitella parasitica]